MDVLRRLQGMPSHRLRYEDRLEPAAPLASPLPSPERLNLGKAAWVLLMTEGPCVRMRVGARRVYQLLGQIQVRWPRCARAPRKIRSTLNRRGHSSHARPWAFMDSGGPGNRLPL
jgi:hypothetical protein